MKSRDQLRQVAVIASTLLVLAVNWLANALPINGQTTGEISDRFQDYFTPAGYVFSIWGVIYLGLIAFTVYHSRLNTRWYHRMQKVGWLYVISCLLNSAWILAWHYNQLGLSVGIMLALLLTLITIYLRLNIGGVRPRRLELWSVDVPFSIYLGWISVAALANTTDAMVNAGLDGEPGWAVFLLAVGSGLAVLMALIRSDAAFLLVFAWAFAGIGVSEAGAALVGVSAWIAAALAVGLAVFSAAWRIGVTRKLGK